VLAIPPRKRRIPDFEHPASECTDQRPPKNRLKAADLFLIPVDRCWLRWTSRDQFLACDGSDRLAQPERFGQAVHRDVSSFSVRCNKTYLAFTKGFMLSVRQISRDATTF
jgi:hypothetical protein